MANPAVAVRHKINSVAVINTIYKTAKNVEEQVDLEPQTKRLFLCRRERKHLVLS